MTALHPSPEWAIAALAALAAACSLAALAYPKGMGMGDVKLCLLLGAMLGRSVIVAIAIGMVTALLPAVVAAVRRPPVRKLAVPFVPFLALGSVVALFWGERILDAYLRVSSSAVLSGRALGAAVGGRSAHARGSRDRLRPADGSARFAQPELRVLGSDCTARSAALILSARRLPIPLSRDYP